ncbi:MAG: 50S ribosomal protein L18 [Cytophagales bacterium]
MSLDKTKRRLKLKKKIRAKIFGLPECPRLTVFRSNEHIYVQLIDDLAGKTLFSASSKKLAEGLSKTQASVEVGKEIAKLASANGIAKVVFDRNGYLYHGRIKALADSAREGGLQF